MRPGAEFAEADAAALLSIARASRTEGFDFDAVVVRIERSDTDADVTEQHHLRALSLDA
jgi:hypothetical protein